MAFHYYLILELFLPFVISPVQPRQIFRRHVFSLNGHSDLHTAYLYCQCLAIAHVLQSCPGTEGWPSIAQWNALNHSISGRLLQPAPPGAVCYPDQPTYNATLCSLITNETSGLLFNVDWYSTLPSASAWPFWHNDSCLPFGSFLSSPWSYEGYPIYVVNATSKHDVKKGVDFARENNVRLVVKASGHDYVGRYHSFKQMAWHGGLAIASSKRNRNAFKRMSMSKLCAYLRPIPGLMVTNLFLYLLNPALVSGANSIQ